MTTRPQYVPAEVVTDLDVDDHSIAQDLLSRLNHVRETTPVAWNPHGGGRWIVTGYDETSTVLRDPATYSSVASEDGTGAYQPDMPRLIPIAFDAPEHTAYRDMIMERFSPANVRQLEDSIRQLAVELIDDFVDQGSCEFIQAFAQPLPAHLFLVLMGWPLEDAEQFTTWMHGISQGEPGALNELRAQTFQEMSAYFFRLIEERRANPRNDLTSVLIEGLYGGERNLSMEELVNYALLLLGGGLHTVQSSLAYSIIAFAEHPEIRRAAIDQPGRLHHVVEEMLRFEAPAWPIRRTTKPVTLGGIDIPADQAVVLVLTGANHDGREFPDPDLITPDRQPNRHLTFGAGPHRCPGSHLARLEIRVAFEEFHRRIPNYEIDPELGYKRHLTAVNGVEYLYLRW
jgi:cytochrome P450